MRLKRAIKCVLCTDRLQFQYVCAERWFDTDGVRWLIPKDDW